MSVFKKKKHFWVRDSKLWLIVTKCNERIPAFILNHDVKAHTLPGNYFRYYGKMKNGELTSISTHKHSFTCSCKRIVCIITMEALDYNWKKGKVVWKWAEPTTNKMIKKRIKNRYGKTALKDYNFARNLD